MSHEDLMRLLGEKAELPAEIAGVHEDVETRERVVRDHEASKDVSLRRRRHLG